MSVPNINALAILNNSPQNVLIWSKLLLMHVLHETYFARFMSGGPNSIVQRIVDLSKSAGDTVKYDVLAQMTGYGVNKNDALLGAEQSLVYYQDSVKIEQKRFASGWYRMSQQRTLHKLRRDAKTMLGDMGARILDEWLFAFLCGTAGDWNTDLDGDIDDHAANGLVAVEAARRWDTGATMSADILDQASWRVRALTPRIRPLRIEGEDRYIIFIRPEQAQSLTMDADFREAQIHARERSSKNPVFTGALGTWNNLIIHVSNYLPYDIAGEVGGGDDLHYAPICGAQAATVAFGNGFSALDDAPAESEGVFFWAEESQDYGNQRGIGAGTILGIKRTLFNSVSHGVFLLTTDENAFA
jgi:N4-gp56 family major capsid protein